MKNLAGWLKSFGFHWQLKLLNAKTDVEVLETLHVFKWAQIAEEKF